MRAARETIAYQTLASMSARSPGDFHVGALLCWNRVTLAENRFGRAFDSCMTWSQHDPIYKNVNLSSNVFHMEQFLIVLNMCMC